ncbi:MAG: hypothetical protein GF330_00725 [Candidatus Eisenbacteria bacterium]|nr:hypothetical protein [Candidatus Eisenbacteria bacterium]
MRSGTSAAPGGATWRPTAPRTGMRWLRRFAANTIGRKRSCPASSGSWREVPRSRHRPSLSGAGRCGRSGGRWSNHGFSCSLGSARSSLRIGGPETRGPGCGKGKAACPGDPCGKGNAVMTRAANCLLLLVLLLALPSAWAEPATPGEAEAVARAYLQLVQAKFGGWGDAQSGTLGRMQELRAGDRLLAFIFDVEPDGFLVVSRHKEIAAVKAFSPRGRLAPEAEGGVVALLRDRLERTIAEIEAATGKPIEEVSAADWQARDAVHAREMWDYLLSPRFQPNAHTRYERTRTEPGMNYQEGDVLLDSHWHQAPPYNDQCPDLGCDWSGDPYYGYNTNALVGCAGIAGVQSTRFWAWPTCAADGSYVDRYYWTMMPSVVDIYSPPDEIDAVAAACYSFAHSMNSDFGCDATSAYLDQFENVFQNRRFHSGCSIEDREDYNTSSWYELCKGQCNDNQVSVYYVENHFVVLDGWFEVWQGGDLSERWLHMNYGWEDSSDNTWYFMDTWPLGMGSDEKIVRGIRPDVSIWDLSGYYPLPSDPGMHFDKPVRYFKRDAVGANAAFAAGHSFQYLRPGFWIRNTGGAADEILFAGEPSLETEFYHRAPFGDVRIKIYDGAIKVKGGGEICFR